jgi:pimeloyl-ACP methyl ester carboxylesterase
MVRKRRLLINRRPTDVLPAGYRAFVPVRTQLAPPLVLVHGNRRQTGRQFRAFLPRALMMGLPVLAPAFDHDTVPGFQRLSGVDGPLAAATALHAVLTDASRVLGLDTAEVDLVGHSAGAQFVHRYLLVFPQGVRKTVLIGAGWYTYLDHARPFPQGIRWSANPDSVHTDPMGLLTRPVHVLVGARDVRRGPSLRSTRGLDGRQGPDRLTRALRWVDHLENEAQRRGVPSQVTFDLLPDTGHSFTSAVRNGGLVQRTLRYLHAPPGSIEDPDFHHGSLQ